MRSDYNVLQTSMKKMTISSGEWESRAYEVEGKLAIVEKKYASSEEKSKKEWKDLEAAYHRSTRITMMMNEHDDEMCPVNLEIG